MGDKKIQTNSSDAIVRAEQAVKELEAQYNKAGIEANQVNAANQEKAAHGDAAAKVSIDKAQKKREAAQKALKEATPPPPPALESSPRFFAEVTDRRRMR